MLISEISHIQNMILNELCYLYRHKGIEEKKQWKLSQNIRYLGGYEKRYSRILRNINCDTLGPVITNNVPLKT